jgi:hypothetical protein
MYFGTLPLCQAAPKGALLCDADFGRDTPAAYNHFAVGWAHAMDQPYQWTKQGGLALGRDVQGTIVHWPSGFTARGEMRTQFHHVIDIAPTVLEAAVLPHPTAVDGVDQQPIEGTSMRYSFRRCKRSRSPRHPVFRDVLQPWHLPPGLDCGHPPLDTLGDGAAPASVRRRRLGALRTERLEPGPTAWQPRCPRRWPSCSSSGSRKHGSTMSYPLDVQTTEV